MIRVPLDLHAAARMDGWRDGFVWPASLPDCREAMRDLLRRYVLAVEKLPPDPRALAWQSTRFLSDMLLAVETAILLDRAEARGIELIGGPEIASVLQGRDPDSSGYTPVSMLPTRQISHVGLREIARSWSWSTPATFLPAMIRPRAVALNHNTLLCEEIVRDRDRVRFMHAFDRFDRAAREHRQQIDRNLVGWTEAIDAVADTISQTVRATPELDAGRADIAATYLADQARPVLRESAELLETARQIPRLPETVMVGSPGQQKLRAMVQEIRSRGGTVTSFDHAAAAGLAEDSTSLVTVEMAASDRFVASTGRVADMIAGNETLRQFASFRSTELVAGRGDPAFLQYMDHGGASGASGAPRRVLYVVGAFDGARRRSPPSLCDPVKLIWWMEMAERMQALPVDFLMQVHPGGSLRGKDNPLHELVPTTGKRFQEAVAWADVLVVDVTQSTTVTEALCIDKPLVLIQYGRNKLYPQVMDMISRRASVIEATYDERGVPQVDADALAQAILDTPASADGAEFREAYGGGGR